MAVASKLVELAPAIPKELTPFGYALAGALGGVFSNAVVYPLDTAKTRIQAASSSSKGKGKEDDVPGSMLEVLKDIYQNEGIGAYYKGFGASMLNTFSMQYAYFFFYSFVRTTYIKAKFPELPVGARPPPLSTAIELSLGAIAGGLAQIFTIPVSVIATRQQLATKKILTPEEERQGKVHAGDGFFQVAREIVASDGIGGLWLGIKPGLVLTVNPAITYGLFEKVKGLVMHGAPANAKMDPFRSFIVGALSKSLATVVTYPYIMAKVCVQAGSIPDDDDDALSKLENGGPGHKKRPAGSLAVLRRVLKTKGVKGWYQGMSAQIMKAMLSQALLFMSKEQFEKYALIIMIAWAKLARSAVKA